MSDTTTVLIVGAGQSGLAIAFGLMRSQVSRVLLVDKAERGREGPWRTYARMHTLRTRARRQRKVHRVSAAKGEGRGVAAPGRLPQLLETGQARAMLSG